MDERDALMARLAGIGEIERAVEGLPALPVAGQRRQVRRLQELDTVLWACAEGRNRIAGGLRALGEVRPAG